MKRNIYYSKIVNSEYFSSIEFDLTSLCNLKCSYCYLEKRERSLGLCYETIDSFIGKYVKPNVSKIKVMEVFFWGGEPLISFETIKYIINSLDNLKSDCIFKYKIITNGTLITHEIAQFCTEKSFSLQVTIDGTKTTHDKNRKQINNKGSYDLIVNNLSILSSNNTDYYIRVTLTPDTGSINSIIEDYSKIGIQKILFGIVTETSEFKIKSQNNYAIKFADEIFYSYLKSSTPLILNIEDFIIIFFADTYRKTCGVSHKKVTVGIDGKLYPCHRFVTKNKFSIGSIEEGLIKNNLPTTEIVEECHICQWRHFCGGYCLYQVLTENDESPLQKGTCIFTQRMIYNILKYIVDLFLNNRFEFNKIANKYHSKGYLENLSQMKCLNTKEIATQIFKKSEELNVIDLNSEGIAYKTAHFGRKYIMNVLSMAILDLIDCNRTAQEITQEIANVCEVEFETIKDDIYGQLAAFQELGLVEEVATASHA